MQKNAYNSRRITQPSFKIDKLYPVSEWFEKSAIDPIDESINKSSKANCPMGDVSGARTSQLGALTQYVFLHLAPNLLKLLLYYS